MNWALGEWSATWRIRYVGHTAIGNSDSDQSLSADSSKPTVVRNIGAYVYNNLQLGYNVEPWYTRFEVGVDNISNKQPPLCYSNNVGNANTDVSTYDLLGRFYWVRATVTF